MNIFIYTTIVTAFVPYKNIYYLSTNASDLEWTHVWIAHQSTPLTRYSKESFRGGRFKKKKIRLMSGHNIFKAIILPGTELMESSVLLGDRTFKGKPPWWCLTVSTGESEREGGTEDREKEKRKKGGERMRGRSRKLERFSSKHHITIR